MLFNEKRAFEKSIDITDDLAIILRCDKRNKMLYVGYEGVENLQISLKIDTKKNPFKECFGINFNKL